MFTRRYRYNLLPILESYGPIDGPKKLIELSEKLNIEFYELQKYIHSRKSDQDYNFTAEHIQIIMDVIQCEWMDVFNKGQQINTKMVKDIIPLEEPDSNVIDMMFKDRKDLKHCPIGTKVVLKFKGVDNTIAGFFQGLSDGLKAVSDIKLKSLNGGDQILGWPFKKLDYYLEQDPIVEKLN